ncbi:hypothetical protein LOK49_LG07G01207 [Camellia lanceoleosa]|uniref:Uncharacterized protein n=1 Tax=Camellia lanceoleosa TaxID=1840588 RepID=A0ACC0H7V9_9ERIC|nr:hypothetical protein LOK49_LG07G01207 [Camellia lanceoleosa]
MPVSGNEETGVLARQSSNCSAGVPIKKRKFPLVRPLSPPPQEPSTLHAENDSLNKEQSNPSQESSLSDASVITNSPGLSDANKSSVPKWRKEGPANSNVYLVNLSTVKLEEPSFITCLGSMDNMDNKKKKLLLTEKSTCLKILENIELHLAATKRDCNLELSTVPGNAELSLGLKEPHIPDLAGQNSEHTIPEKVDPSFYLSLGKAKAITKCRSDDLNLYNDRDCLHANRSNWDLNTTMDAWEGSIGDTATGQGVAAGFDGSNAMGCTGTHDVKPSISSTGFLGSSVDLGKQILGGGEKRSNFLLSSLSSSQQYKNEDSLGLQLSTPCFLPSNCSGEHSGSSAKVVSNLHGVLVPTGNMSSIGGMTVKSEPYDENAKHEARGNPPRSLDFRTSKHEVAERCSLETLKLSNTSPQKLVEPKSVKSELVQDNLETQKTTKEPSHQSDGKVVQCENNCSSMMEMAVKPQKPSPSGLPTCSTELSMSGDMSNQPECSGCTKEVHINNVAPHERCNNVEQVALETVFTSMENQSKGSTIFDGMIETSGAKDLNVKDPETCRLKLMNEFPPDSRGNGEGSLSDEEKFNILTNMLEDSYSSDCESDGNHDVVTMVDAIDGQFREEDDEYEDGEVREQQLHTASEGPVVEKKEAENVNFGDCDIKNVDSGSLGEGIITESGVDENERKLEEHPETSDDHIKECVDAVVNEKAEQGVDKDGSLQEPLTVEVAGAESDEKRSIKATQRKLLDRSGGKDVETGHETEISSAGATNVIQGTVTTVVQPADGNTTDTLEKPDSTMPKTDPFLNGNDGAKDVNTGGNRSRIINLPRATNVSPSKTSYIPGRSLPSQSGRDRYVDFEGGKVHPRGNREEIYIDGPRKFMRERIQDQPLRNSRLNFMRGRGRGSNRLDTLRGDWDSDRDFAPEIYNGPADYRFSRHKRDANAAADAELHCNGYIVAPDGAIIGTGRGGRKPLNDELPSFRHLSSRRRSPGGRDGPHNVACKWRGQKFTRGLPEDIMDPAFTRRQPPYDGVDNRFARGSRNFPSVQRRGLPRIRSKSPIRSRTRSPGPWSSPRRRSPDGFNGLPELMHRRSPAIYRMERMRSPDRPCFPEERLARRHGSPPFISRPANDLRDMESGRDHGQLRSVMPNRRSPSDRVLPRNNRRFDILDPRERTDTDEYFGGPMHSGRFHELDGDGNGDERRNCDDDGPRPFRFCPEADSEFIERSNLREREFDGRIKNRSVNASRRTRSIEEQEGNYRHGGQVWHDDGFDDSSRGKRRRF